MIEDGAFDRGSVTTVQRVGDTIRRPVGLWTPTVHALLDHLARTGFHGAPRVLGIDQQGREILSLLTGAVARRPWPRVLHTNVGLIALIQMLQAYHTAVQSFIPPADARWFVPGLRWSPGQIVRHGDLGPWNTIWADEQLVGLIDWDSIEPGTCLEDLAQLAWYCVPLRDDQHARAARFDTIPDRHKRLRVLCSTYGASILEVVSVLQQLQQREIERITNLAERGFEPWRTFRARGDSTEIAAEHAWLVQNTDTVILNSKL